MTTPKHTRRGTRAGQATPRIPEYYDLHGSTALVMGLGVHGGGLGATEWLWNHGADVIVTDLRDEAKLAKSLAQLKDRDRITYVLGKHDVADFRCVDFVVKNPGVPRTSPYLAEARKHRVPVIMDISIFFDRCPAPIIGITGTRGKTTTTRWIHYLLSQWKKVDLAGNLGISPLSILDQTSKDVPVILEMSSWQCEGLASVKRSPRISVLTTIFPDHMNTYTSLLDYAKAKWEIVRYQTADDLAIINDDEPMWSRLLKLRPIESRILRYSSTHTVPHGGFLRDRAIVLRNGHAKSTRPEGSVTIPRHLHLAPHQISNLVGAVTTAWAAGMPITLIARALDGLPAVPYRLEERRMWRGHRFINDTTSTIPDSTILAIDYFKDPLVLIAGGSEKNLDFHGLARTIVKRRLPLVLFDAPASHRLWATIEEVDRDHHITPVWATSMKDAVKQAIAIAPAQATILLSPACASFGMFTHEFDRGDQFNAEVKRLKD